MIFAGDMVIRNLIDLSLQDMRKNIWLFDDIFSSFTTDPYLAAAGAKEIENAKNWFLNNRVDVLLRYRIDKDQFPCVTVGLGSSVEKDDMKHLADLTPFVETLMPADIGKPIPYMVRPFTPLGFDVQTKTLLTPDTVDLGYVNAGMILVNPDNSVGYVITGTNSQGITIALDTSPAGTVFGVVPQYPVYKVRREHTFFQENYQIGCHVHGDPAPLLWLHAIVLYSILRYREVLLEGKNFSQSSVSSTDLVADSSLGGAAGELVYSRFINLTGMVENSWLKTPYRVIENALLRQEDGIRTGIKIISNLDSPPSLNTVNDPWITVKE